MDGKGNNEKEKEVVLAQATKVKCMFTLTLKVGNFTSQAHRCHTLCLFLPVHLGNEKGFPWHTKSSGKVGIWKGICHLSFVLVHFSTCV